MLSQLRAIGWTEIKDLWAIVRENPLESIGVVLGTWVAIKVFAKFCSNERIAIWIDKLQTVVRPASIAAGVSLSFLLLKWLPRKWAEKAEQGIIGTALIAVHRALTVLSKAPLWMLQGLVKDNANASDFLAAELDSARKIVKVCEVPGDALVIYKTPTPGEYDYRYYGETAKSKIVFAGDLVDVIIADARKSLGGK